jgi:hypothetical protein
MKFLESAVILTQFDDLPLALYALSAAISLTSASLVAVDASHRAHFWPVTPSSNLTWGFEYVDYLTALTRLFLLVFVTHRWRPACTYECSLDPETFGGDSLVSFDHNDS